MKSHSNNEGVKPLKKKGRHGFKQVVCVHIRVCVACVHFLACQHVLIVYKLSIL